MEGKIVESCEELYCRKLDSEMLHKAMSYIAPRNRMWLLLHYVSNVPISEIESHEDVSECVEYIPDAESYRVMPK